MAGVKTAPGRGARWRARRRGGARARRWRLSAARRRRRSRCRSGKRAPAGKSTAKTRARRRASTPRPPATPTSGSPTSASPAAKVGAGHEEPLGKVKDVRVDLPPGLAVNPEATEQCTEAQLDAVQMPGRQPGRRRRSGGHRERAGTAASRAHRDRTLPGLRHAAQARAAGTLRRRSEQPRARTARHGSDTTCAGRSTSKAASAGSTKRKRAKAAASRRATTTSTSRSRTSPNEPEVIESKLIFWGIPQEHTHIGSARRLHHAAEHVHEQAGHLPARRLLRRRRARSSGSATKRP